MTQLIANALRCQQRPGLSLVESIVEFLKVRNLLLVLDNCEHLLDDAADLAAAVLRACPDVTVLATSREALEVDGEHVVRVKSLQEDAAVRMFDDRARDAGATATWTDEQWVAIAEICRRVDGIPLAIELAAARVEAMSPMEIADASRRALPHPHRQASREVERQQTLRATVDWSYQLLSPDERTVFNRLGIFVGSFDAEAASAVASDAAIDAWQVREAVASLVAKSMLVTEVGPVGTTRYSMLETLRVFARDQLDQIDDADVWRRRHPVYVASFAEAFAVGAQGSDDLAWSARLKPTSTTSAPRWRGPSIAATPKPRRSPCAPSSAWPRSASGTARSCSTAWRSAPSRSWPIGHRSGERRSSPSRRTTS